MLPTVGISPPNLAPVVLFENSFKTSATQIVSLTNQGNRTVAFNVRSFCVYASSLINLPRSHADGTVYNPRHSNCSKQRALLPGLNSASDSGLIKTSGHRCLAV